MGASASQVSSLALVARPDPVLVLNERGGPVPPPDILRRIRAIAPELGLRFNAAFDSSNWAFTRDWPETDARWARVRSQEISRESAYDIIGYLPIDCSVEQAASYVEQHLRNYPLEHVRALHASMQRWNESEVPTQQISALVSESVDAFARDRRQKTPRRTRIEVTR